MTEKVIWPLGDGMSLPFTVYDRNEGWNDVPGLYIFAFVSGGRWHSLYVGQADSFKDRLPNHERLKEAIQKGATHIHATVVHNQTERDIWERKLIQTLQPPMNVQHRRTG
jgi:excinuclease UvrABC nuclease subunit